MLEQIGFLKLTFSKHSKNPVIALKWLIILQFVYILHQCDSRGVIPLLLLPPSAQAFRPQLPKRGVLLFSHLPFIPVFGIPWAQELLPPPGSSVQVPDWLEEARFHHQFCRLWRHTQVRIRRNKSCSVIVVPGPTVYLNCL